MNDGDLPSVLPAVFPDPTAGPFLPLHISDDRRGIDDDIIMEDDASGELVAIDLRKSFDHGFSFNWQARQDSNLRIRESKSRALPLGDAPMALRGGIEPPFSA
jgi:hypothetical protein